jgi:peptidoglycan hydrolase CwlO-like protein
MKSNVILGALLRKTQIRLIDSNKQSSELANEMSCLLDQLSSKQSSKKNILEERIKKIRTNISKMQQNIDI